MSNIRIAVDHAEAAEFVEWLNANGHTAEQCDDTGNWVDGVWTSTDDEAAWVLGALWTEYCNS